MSQNKHKIDKPIDNAADDLFEFQSYIRNLSEALIRQEPPYTVGVYGHWGQGKTSFVNLLLEQIKNDLNGINTEKQPIVVRFSAWAFNDSETLWKALVLKIADSLYPTPVFDENQTAEEEEEEPKVSWLKTQVFQFDRKREEEKATTYYNELVEKLNTASFPGISKSRESKGKVQDNTFLSNLVLTSVETLTKVSPILSGVKDLLGLKDDRVKDLFNLNKEETQLQQISFTNRFSKLLKDLYIEKAKGHKMFVFIDDLDRCFPDVALDILEAIKIFLNDITCTFLVAVDERLISQGLEMRFKDLSSFSQGKKGEEYIEKIIQFRIPIPPLSSKMVRDYISTQFPRWTIASDIINIGIGSNPRKLLQFCNTLSFKYAVYKSKYQPHFNEEQLEKKYPELIDKLLCLGAFDEDLTQGIRQIIEDNTLGKEAKETFIKGFEERLKAEDPSKALENLQQEAFGEVKTTFGTKLESPNLKCILDFKPAFSQNTIELIRQAITFANLRFDFDENGKHRLITDDERFLRIYEGIKQGLTWRDFYREDYRRLKDIFVGENGPETIKELQQIATAGNWSANAAWLNTLLEDRNKVIPTHVAPEVKELVYKYRDKPVRDQLLEGYSLACIPSSSFLVLTRILFDRGEKIEQDYPLNLEENTRNLVFRITEKELFPETTGDLKKTVEDVKNDYCLQVSFVNYILSLRVFTLIEVLISYQPEFGKKLRALGRSYLEELQRYIEDRNGVFIKKYDEWEDEITRQIAGLSPKFKEIREKQIFEFFAAANLNSVNLNTIQDNNATISQQDYNYVDYFIKISKAEQTALEVNVEENDPLSGSNNPTFSTAELGSDPTRVEGNETYSFLVHNTAKIEEVKFEGNNENSSSLHQTVTIKTQTINEILDSIDYLFSKSISSGGDGSSLNRHKKIKTERPFARIEDLGTVLFNILFDADGHKTARKNSFYDLLTKGEDNRWRLVFFIKESTLNSLPWETIFIPRLKLFPALIGRKYSVVRMVKGVGDYLKQQSFRFKLFFPPLRILIVTANPKDLGYLDSFQEVDKIKSALEGAKGNVEIKTIKNTTIADLKDAVNEFNPHLFHFGGHGIYWEEEGEGALILEKEDGNHQKVKISDILKIIAEDTQIIFALLNGCDTGKSSTDDIYSSVAEKMVEAGIPVALASTRAIMDHISIAFVEEFYRVFAKGFPLEIALTEARKQLDISNWNWSDYSLFVEKSFLNRLHEIRIQPNTRSEVLER